MRGEHRTDGKGNLFRRSITCCDHIDAIEPSDRAKQHLHRRKIHYRHAVPERRTPGIILDDAGHTQPHRPRSRCDLKGAPLAKVPVVAQLPTEVQAVLSEEIIQRFLSWASFDLKAPQPHFFDKIESIDLETLTAM